MAAAFQTKIKVRFGDVDRAGIAYYPRIIDYFHFAFEEFWEVYAKIPYQVLINRENLGFPNVHMEVDFREPLSFGDLLNAKVSVARIGKSSVVFHFELCRGKTICVAADLTLVAVDMKTFKPKPIPEKFRKLFRKVSA